MPLLLNQQRIGALALARAEQGPAVVTGLAGWRGPEAVVGHGDGVVWTSPYGQLTKS
jgi:hypothetical protein